MPTPPVNPFPFPAGYFRDPNHVLEARSMRDYVKIFLSRRAERPGGRFHDVDISELMRLAEDIGAVHKFEIAYIRKLIRDHPDYFRHEAQINRLRKYAERHKELNKARKDDFLDDVLSAVPIAYFRDQKGTAFLRAAKDLSGALKASDEFHSAHDTDNPALVEKVNQAAAKLRTFVKGLTLSDVDKPGRAARAAHLRNVLNLLAHPFGAVDHESKWFRIRRKWVNWNRDITVYPKKYRKPKNLAAVKDEIRKNDPLRMAAGGHAFNITSSMGGKRKKRIGGLVTLDNYKLASGKQVNIVDPNEAAKYNLKGDQADRVVRASAGMRLRDFTKAVSKMGNTGLALPVAGSTDAQSIGGLIATDLHSTGHSAGFLSQQLLELKVLDANGAEHSFFKDESVARGKPGRWIWRPPRPARARKLSRLPVAGALGVCGVVVEVMLKLDAAFNFRKTQQLVPRKWAEDKIGELLKKKQPEELFAYDHVSFYYAGGGGEDLPTVRLNGWKRTNEPISNNAELLKSSREILDHVGSAFLPNALLRLARLTAPDPGNPDDPDADDMLKNLNKRKPLVLAAKDAFARKLYFQHDEIEVGIPLPVKNGKPQYSRYQQALGEVQELLLEEEMRTVIEVRFTPDASEAMIGPGTGGRTCYLELAAPLGEYSRKRIRQVFSRFDDLLRANYDARSHLGKKSTATFADMKHLYGDIWDEFNEVRLKMDPGGRFLPAENELLQRVFVKRP